MVTFRSTVMCGNRLNAWNTMPICRLTRLASTPGPVMSWPNRLIRPASIGSSRLMHRSNVDFPDPEAPIRQITSCEATDMVMPRSTSFLSNDLCRSSILSASLLTGTGPPSAGTDAALTGSPRPACADQRRVLLQADEVVEQRRNDVAYRLRKHDVPQRGAVGQAERARRGDLAQVY